MNAASVRTETSHILGMIQKPSDLFVFSNERWDVLRTKTKNNLQSRTRWWTKAVNTLVNGFEDVTPSIKQLEDNVNQPNTYEVSILLFTLLQFLYITNSVAWAQIWRRLTY